MWRQSSCCGGDQRVKQIRVGNVIIGLAGLEDALEQLHAANRHLGPAAAEELLARIKARNYVARGDEEDYKAALLREYAAYRAARQGE
jgi:hypothetical protein